MSNTYNSRIVALVISFAVVFQPFAAIAQSSPSGNNPRQPFNPNATLNFNNNTFGGVSFGGVGGAIASCANVGGLLAKGISKATDSINGIFKEKDPAEAVRQGGQGNAQKAAQATGADTGGVGGPVPVTDDPAMAQLKQSNRREGCLNGIAYAVAKSMLQSMVQKTLSWVNTGFDGNPLYVRDIDSYLKTLRDEKISRFLSKIPDENPIFGNAIRSIVTEQVTGISDGFIDKTMDTPQGRAYKNFQDDFTNGGWEAFLDPNNNPIGAIFESADRLNRSISTDEQNARSELERNSGFLDMKRCVEYEQPSSKQNNRPFSYTNDFVDRCIRWETVTPGSVISAQVNAITTSPIRQLEQADQINEVLGSFFDQLLNRLFTRGLSSLSKRGGSTGFGGPGANVVIGSDGAPANTSIGDVFDYQAGASGIQTTDFDISRPQQLRVILQAQYDYLNHSLDARVAMNRIVPALGALDYCIPGPNPTWQEGLQDNVNTYFGSLQEVQKESSFGRKLLQTITVGLSQIWSSDPKSHTIAAADVALYDKAIRSTVTISDTIYFVRKDTPQEIYNAVQARFKEVMALYKDAFNQDNIKNAFLAADPTNASYVGGFVESAFKETAKLPRYDQAIGELDLRYSDSEKETRSAIAELESIREEVNQIVATAKARYIAERAAAGTPVNRSCIDRAYQIDQSAIVPVARLESDAPSPLLNQSIDGGNYFYSNL